MVTRKDRVYLTFWEKKKDGPSHSLRYNANFVSRKIPIKQAWKWSNSYYVETFNGILYRCGLRTRLQAKAQKKRKMEHG